MAMSAAAESGAAVEAAHKELLTHTDLQFTFDDAAVREVSRSPQWLRDFFEWLNSLFSVPAEVMTVLMWGAVAAFVLVILFLIAREVGALDWTRKRPQAPPGEPLYRPEAQVALALLADADALAAEGRYEEAVHVLLLRSVEDMRRWRPRAVEPSFTSRDLSGLAILPPAARDAFSAMARLVETSLFGGRAVGQEGFAESRRAYEAFALPGVWA